MPHSEQSTPTAFMDRWWGVLKVHGVSTSTVVETSNIRGLRISVVPTDAEAACGAVVQRCRALRDALELVFLQSIMDYRGFVNSLVNQERDELKSSIMDLLWEARAFPCHVDERCVYPWPQEDWVTKLWIRTAISTLLTPQQLHERDQAFQDTRQQLLAAAGTRDVDTKLNISVGMAPGDCAFELAHFVCTAPPPPVDYPFSQVVLDFFIWKDFQAECADVVTCLNDKHNRVSLGSACAIEAVKLEAAAYGNLLAACFQPEESSSQGSAKDRPRASINLVLSKSHRLLTLVCSAVMSARGVESLALNWTPKPDPPRLESLYLWNLWDEKRRFKRWMMVSLFSPFARHSIHQLQLNKFYVDNADMNDFEAFLLGSNQLNALRWLAFGVRDVIDEEATFLPRDQIFLVKGTKLWLNAFATNDEATRGWETARLERSCWADVVVNDITDAKYRDMLVPGYGWCKVRRSDAHEQRTIGQTQAIGRLMNHGITSLTLKWKPPRELRGQFDYPGFHRFLHLVGTPLEKLVLSGVGSLMPQLETIWAACPLLTHLELRKVSSDVLRRIVDAYESGQCHVTSLKVRRLKRRRGFQDMVEFCETLCDPERQISKTLTQLYLDVRRSRVEGVADQELASMLQLLDRNQKLIWFSVGVREMKHAPIVALLKAKNNEFLPNQGVPLPIRAKMAFLSAMDSSSSFEATTLGLNGRRGITWLDSDVLRWILEMAATPVKRKVFVVW